MNMKTSQDFTQKIKNRIPIYKARMTDMLYSGKEHKVNKIEDTVKYIEKVYEIAGFKKPIVVIAKNPNEYKILFEILEKNKKYIELAYKIKNNSQLDSQLDSQLHSQLDSQLDLSLIHISEPTRPY